VVGAPGQGQWAEIPWIGLFNPEVTTSAKRGYYIVYLFSVDMMAVVLSLALGVRNVREEFKDNTTTELIRRAGLIRDRVPEFAERFVPGPVTLGGTTPLAKDYDHAVSIFKGYTIGDLPACS